MNMKIGIVILEEEGNIQNREEIKNSICRYLKYVIFKNKNRIECGGKLWGKFWEGNNFKDWNDINAILFLTFERMPWGDYPESLWNTSRPVRMFVENTMDAISTDWENVLMKLKELVLKILKGDEK